MFLNYFKDYFLKKKLKNYVSNVADVTSDNKVQTVGILVDETFFFQTLALKEALVNADFLEKNIAILAFKADMKNNQVSNYPVFSWEHINWSFQIQEASVLDFIQNPFDVLVSYYDTNNSFLQWITYQSKASFKVGLLINTVTQNYKQFVQEFVRILHLFNKI
jgi:hypothetical protein